MRLKSLKAQGIKNLDIPASDDGFSKLEFPDKGKVFIHGLNEAGKSTLFESTYFALFGTALIPDRSRASMSELLAYDRDKAVVELEFTIQDSLYRVRRTIDDSKSRTDYTHKLVIEHPDKAPEGIKSASSVNQRIEQEIGLDGDALLNSCFVQQKNLDRLEDSSRQRREESIATLLNLDRFTTMENDYSSKQDTVEEELETAQQKQTIAEIEEEKIPEKEEALEEVESRLDVIQWKKDVEGLNEDIESFRSRIGDRIQEIHGQARDIQEINKLEEKLPEKKARKEKLDDLHTDFVNLEKLEKALQELESLESLDKEIGELDSEIEDLKDDRESISDEIDEVREQLENYEYLELLNEWRRLKNAVNREDQIEKQRQDFQDKKSEAENQLKTVRRQKSTEESKRRTYGGFGAAVTIGGIVAGFLVTNIAFAGVILGIAIAAYASISYDPNQYDSEIDTLSEQVSQHETELTKLEGKEEDLETTESENPEKELAEVESGIKDLDRQVPSTLDERSELESEIETELDEIPHWNELEAKEEQLQDEIPRDKEIRSREADLEEKRREREELDGEEIQNRIAESKDEIVGEEKEFEAIESELEVRAEELDVEPTKEEVNSEKSSLETEIANDEQGIGDREAINNQIAEKNQKVEELRKSISDVEDRIGELEEQIEQADSDPDIDEVSELERGRDDIVGGLGDLRGRRDDLRDELGISEDLGLEEVQDEVEEKQHDVRLYGYAEEIVSRSKKQIMRNILPKTQNHMARFLPILTNGRYKDVRIDPDSYTIEAYDGRAQTYKSKSIFSGGTKDQFSLALRLSFAMATLPQERGIAPDFLYLDEPVGSFDSNRQEALTELLTRGEIAENFGQIFIVSHVEELRNEFDQYIEMDDGRIADMELEA